MTENCRVADSGVYACVDIAAVPVKLSKVGCYRKVETNSDDGSNGTDPLERVFLPTCEETTNQFIRNLSPDTCTNLTP